MKKNVLILFLLLLFSANYAQQIQFVQENVGACDSTNQVAITAFLVPGNMAWDSVHWYVKGVLYSKNQKTKANLGDSLMISFFYDNPVNTVKDTFAVMATHKLRVSSEIIQATRFAAGRAQLVIEDSLLFNASNWSLSSGNIVSSSSTNLLLRGYGNITATLTYNTGCTEAISVFIPIADKPDLVLQQTVLADPIGIPGTITGSLTDASTISSVNGNVLNATSFTIQLNAGSQTINVLSGSFSWTENIYVQSAEPPKYRIEQVQNGRWCDGSQAVVRITTDRGIIDMVSHAIIEPIGNDTAYITTVAGRRFFTVQNGSYTNELSIDIIREDSPDVMVIIEDIIKPTCSGSNDGELVISYPANMQALTVNGNAVVLEDTIRNLPEGSNILVFTDARLCDFTKNVEIPISGNPCFSSPDFFSPNSDGFNDIWIPKVPAGSQVSFVVYSYRNLNMESIAKKKIFEGNDSWNGIQVSSGDAAPPGYYIIVGTINYPPVLNWPAANFREIIKLAR